MTRAVGRLRLFGKAGCHLCDLARDQLWSLAEHARTPIEEVDILSDASLFASYRWRVPVVVVDGVEVAEGRLSSDDLRRVASALSGTRGRGRRRLPPS